MKIKKPNMYGDPVMQGNKMLSMRAGPSAKDRGTMTLGKSTDANAKNASPISMETEGGHACSRQNKRSY